MQKNKYNIAVIPGDGIGTEVMPEALKVLNKVSNKYGINLQGVSDDTMVLSYVYNSGIMRHNLDSLASMYLDYELSLIHI